MDECYQQLKAEIEALKSQLGEVRAIQFEASATAGASDAICETFVPIGTLPPQKPIPGNFEPTFADDNGTMKLASVGFGFAPFGRRFYLVSPSLDNSAKIEEGIIYLEVTHPTSGGVDPSFSIKGQANGYPNFGQSSKSVSLIPLYEIDSGAMTIDYRSCMSLTVREL